MKQKSLKMMTVDKAKRGEREKKNKRDSLSPPSQAYQYDFLGLKLTQLLVEQNMHKFLSLISINLSLLSKVLLL